MLWFPGRICRAQKRKSGTMNSPVVGRFNPPLSFGYFGDLAGNLALHQPRWSSKAESRT